MDGVPGVGAGLIESGGETTYEFNAEPFGLHLYHCHAGPLAEHIARGLYGAFIVDPKQGRPDADELLMVMNGFNTNFDAEGNQVYAVNTVAFHYVNEPIAVQRDEPIRIYLVNVLEYDPINSFHIHGELLQPLPDRDLADPDRVHRHPRPGPGPAGGARDVFPYAGDYMFHAHKTEFAELGWMGFFRVGGEASGCARRPRSAISAIPRGRRADGGRGRAERRGLRVPTWVVAGAAGADRGRDRLLRPARGPRARRAPRAAGRGAGGRADRAPSRRDRADPAQHRAR